MKWGGHKRWLNDRLAAAGFDKSERVIPANLVFHADALVEIDQVRAAAQQNVLAVVHNFAGARMFVGRSASPEVGTLFEEPDAESATRQGASGGQSGQAAANHGNCRGPLLAHHKRRFTTPFPSISSFSLAARRTFSWKTSYCRLAIFSSSR